MRANRESRVVVTLDADFHALMALSNEAVPSVIRLRIEGLRGEALAALLQRVLQVIPDALDQGGVAVTVTEKSIRLRHLSQAAS